MKIRKCMIIAAAIFLSSNMNILASADTYGSTAADITFEPGTLTLAEMSSFSFGSYTISADTIDYPAVQATVFLDVRDLRGTGRGWNVTAMASRFNPGVKPTLPGTSINLINGEPTTTQPAGDPPNVNQNIQLDCDGAATADIASAATDTGLGVWSIEWNGSQNNNTNVTLTVPGGIATEGTHTATITWTLADTP